MWHDSYFYLTDKGVITSFEIYILFPLLMEIKLLLEH